jgi:S1-C subfamily serine protease
MTEPMVMEKLSIELSEIVEQASRSIVLVQGRRLPSSGIVWQKNLVVSADHALPRTEELQIKTSTGETIVGTVMGRDPSIDIAMIKLEADLPPVENSPDVKLKAGQLGVCLGRANGGRVLAALTMVSGVDENYRNWRGGTLDQFLRLDVTPYPGFSGSALLLPNGKIAGMTTSVFSRHFGLAIPASNIERQAQRLLAKGSIGKPYLGVMMQPIRLPEQLQQSGGGKIGLILVGIEKASPAEKAGLLIGDILVRFDEKTVNSIENVHDFINQDSIGKSVNIQIIRGGKLQEMQINIGERTLQQRME